MNRMDDALTRGPADSPSGNLPARDFKDLANIHAWSRAQPGAARSRFSAARARFEARRPAARGRERPATSR